MTFFSRNVLKIPSSTILFDMHGFSFNCESPSHIIYYRQRFLGDPGNFSKIIVYSVCLRITFAYKKALDIRKMCRFIDFIECSTYIPYESDFQ